MILPADREKLLELPLTKPDPSEKAERMEAALQFANGIESIPCALRVNAISAGPIKTLAARGISGLSDMMKAHAERAPLQRNVDVNEVADTAVFLSSDGGAGITGETIYVDCGYNIMGF